MQEGECVLCWQLICHGESFNEYTIHAFLVGMERLVQALLNDWTNLGVSAVIKHCSVQYCSRSAQLDPGSTGGLLGNDIDALRSPSTGFLNGLQLILPALPNGGVEIVMGVEGMFLDRLLRDPVLNKFAVAR
jgi:hypothetical protein